MDTDAAERLPGRDQRSVGGADDLPATISVERAGEILGVSRRSAYRAVERGQIPTIRLGRRLLVPTAELLRMLGIERGVDVGSVVGADTES